MFWMPEVLLGFFGEGFTTGSSLLRVLVLGQLINALTGPVGFALLMAKRERAFAWSMGIAAMANVLGNYIAVPLWGAFGAACVTASTVGVLNLTQLFLSRRIKFENTLPA
jgi:O-antigen/teichoic acid export membrane protein